MEMDDDRSRSFIRDFVDDWKLLDGAALDVDQKELQGLRSKERVIRDGMADICFSIIPIIMKKIFSKETESNTKKC